MAVLLAERALHCFKAWVQQDICTATEVVIQGSAVPDIAVSVSCAWQSQVDLEAHRQSCQIDMLLCQESHRLVHTSPPAGKSRLRPLRSSSVKHQAVSKAVRLPSLRSRPPLAYLDHQSYPHRRSLCLSLLHMNVVMIKLRLLLEPYKQLTASSSTYERPLQKACHGAPFGSVRC